jgi:hypothetical protein
MSFKIKARRQHREIFIEYLEDLQSIGFSKGSAMSLGWVDDGAVSFILGGPVTSDISFGDEIGFGVSSMAPTAWMQASLDTIGQQTLREMAMPASHDAGMYEIACEFKYGGSSQNTLTQTRTIYEQLIHGARFLDLRPVLRQGVFWAGHFTKTNTYPGALGGLGGTFEDMVNDINSFNKYYPGELIILEISHDMSRNHYWEPFSDQEWQSFYEIMSKLEHLHEPGPMFPDNLSEATISDFIETGGPSRVLIRLPRGAPRPIVERDEETIAATFENLAISTNEESAPVINVRDVFPFCFYVDEVTALPAIGVPVTRPYAFIREDDLPLVGSYSDTKKSKELAKDQLEKLQRFRSSPTETPLRSTWTLTQDTGNIIDGANQEKGIIGMSPKAHTRLYTELWSAMSNGTYPNLIEIDNFHNSQVTALAMAINRIFANPYDAGHNKERIKRDGSFLSTNLAPTLQDNPTEDVPREAEPGDKIIWDQENIANWCALQWCELRRNQAHCAHLVLKYENHRRLLIAGMWAKELFKLNEKSKTQLLDEMTKEKAEIDRVKEYWIKFWRGEETARG